MANESKKTGFPGFFTDIGSADTVRRQFLEAPLEAASQTALGSALELAAFLGTLPEAFIASQRRELGRVEKSGEENDSRAAALKASIEQAEVLQTSARRAQVRAQRALVTLADNKDVFHGFVSDAAFAPLKELTVRLIDSNHPRVNPLSAITDDDGYFSIPLGTKRKASPGLSQIVDLFTGLGQQPDAAPAAAASTTTRQVEILRKATLLHSDPVPVTQGGSTYREYVIPDTEPASPSEYRDFVSGGPGSARSSKPKRKKK